MITKQEVKKNLLERIDTPLKELGFRKNNSHQAFYRKMDFGKQSFHLAFVSQVTNIDVLADIAIRFDALEELISTNTRSFLPAHDRENTFSVGTEIGKLMKLSSQKWNIRQLTESEQLANSVIEAFHNYAEPYLKRYSTLESIFTDLSAGGDKAENLNILPLSASLNLIALAFLLGEKEKFCQFGVEREIILRRIPNSGIETFIELRENLEAKILRN